MIITTKEQVIQKSNIERDGYIDFFEGLLIIWVINIHTVFYSGDSCISDKIWEVSGSSGFKGISRTNEKERLII